MSIALTGTSGGVGSAVLRELGRGTFDGAPILIGRDASALAPGYEHREAAYGDEAMTAALAGVDTLFFVSGRESATRLDEHLSVVASAVEAGVRRIVYLSFLGAAADSIFTLGRHHYFTEQAIRESGLAFTFLRDSCTRTCSRSWRGRMVSSAVPRATVGCAPSPGTMSRRSPRRCCGRPATAPTTARCTT
ncbi:MAG: NAD(P)H-binding protein [Galbitalea sp.]